MQFNSNKGKEMLFDATDTDTYTDNRCTPSKLGFLMYTSI